MGRFAWVLCAVGLAAQTPVWVAEPYLLTPLLELPHRAAAGIELRSVDAAGLNQSGQIVVLGRYSRAPDQPPAAGLFLLHAGQLVPVLLEDQQTALAGSLGYTDFRQPLLNDAGTIVVTARRIDGSAGRQMILRIQGTSLTMLVAEDQERPGGRGRFAPPLAIAFNSRGDVLFESGGGMYLARPGGIQTLAEPGDPAPGVDAEWIEAGGGAMNDAGQVVFTGLWSRQGTPAAGLWLWEGGTTRLAAKFGDWIPGHFPQSLASFSQPAISPGGTIAFGAVTAGRIPGRPADYNARGIFVLTSGVLAAISPSGAQVDGVGAASHRTPPRPVFDWQDQLYWSDILVSATAERAVVVRWNPTTASRVLVRAAGSSPLNVPEVARSGLMLLNGEGLSVMSTLSLASAAQPGQATAVLPAGSIVSGFRRLSAGAPAATGAWVAEAAPLPVALGGYQVRLGGRAAPLFFAAPNQVNFQTPGAAPGAQLVEMICNDVVVATGLWLPGPAPALFTASHAGSGQVVALNEDGSVNRPGTSAARRTRVVQIFGTGAGPGFLSSAGTPLILADGQPAPATGLPLYHTTVKPSVYLGPEPAPVLFSGLAPGLVGVWQVNFVAPANAPTGPAVPLTVTYNGVAANPVTLAIQ